MNSRRHSNQEHLDHVQVASNDLLREGPLEALQEIDPQVRVLGARIVALTPEPERYTRGVHKKLNLTFDILTDLHLKTAEQFRLVFVLPDYLRDLYRSFGSTLDRFHDESEYRLPMPARYVIDKQGSIRAA